MNSFNVMKHMKLELSWKMQDIWLLYTIPVSGKDRKDLGHSKCWLCFHENCFLSDFL